MVTQSLEVRIRHVLGSDHSSTRMTVYCPKKEATVPLGACVTCAHSEGVEVDPGHKRATVLCDPGESAPEGAATISSLMSRRVVCVTSDLEVAELIPLLEEHGISGVPVVDALGQPVGLVSRADVIRASVEAGFKPLAGLTVDLIMTPIAFTLPEHASIERAVAMMAEDGLHRLPIVAKDGEVVGIVSSTDIMRWIASRNEG